MHNKDQATGRVNSLLNIILLNQKSTYVVTEKFRSDDEVM